MFPCDPALDFASGLTRADGPLQRQELFARTLENFGVRSFAYLNQGRRFQPWHLETTYSGAWIEHYLRQGYAEHDPVLAEARRSPLPFAWAALLKRSETSEAGLKVFRDAQDFDIRDGMTMPIHGADGFAMMSLVIGDDSLMGPKAAAERQTVRLMTLYYHQAVEMETVRRQDSQFSLTAREREVLRWTAGGKTGWEIAQILGIGERTVVFHIENAKTKLGAASRSHAAAKAAMLGLVEV